MRRRLLLLAMMSHRLSDAAGICDIPEPIQGKQFGLVSRKSNLIDRIVDQLHLRIEHWVDALQIQQISSLHIDNLVRISGWRLVRVDVRWQPHLIVLELWRSHGGCYVARGFLRVLSDPPLARAALRPVCNN
jgi:hypothetical protein